MTITTDIFGDEMPNYASRAEESAALDCYLRGDYGKLTLCEVAFFRACESDPGGVKGDAEHAGELVGITEMELYGVLFVYFPLSESLDESREKLLQMIGPHPITPARLWRVVRRLV